MWGTPLSLCAGFKIVNQNIQNLNLWRLSAIFANKYCFPRVILHFYLIYHMGVEEFMWSHRIESLRPKPAEIRLVTNHNATPVSWKKKTSWNCHPQNLHARKQQISKLRSGYLQTCGGTPSPSRPKKFKKVGECKRRRCSKRERQVESKEGSNEGNVWARRVRGRFPPGLALAFGCPLLFDFPLSGPQSLHCKTNQNKLLLVLLRLGIILAGQWSKPSRYGSASATRYGRRRAVCCWWWCGVASAPSLLPSPSPSPAVQHLELRVRVVLLGSCALAGLDWIFWRLFFSRDIVKRFRR